MKTTIELPDALLREVKAAAREGQTTMRQLVIEGLRAELARRRTATTAKVDFVFPTYGTAGADTWPELTPGEFTEMAYGDRA